MAIILNLIVKDEMKSLPILLDSVKAYVTDYVIVDTGSSDGTPRMLEERGIKVHHKRFEDFGASRNQALQLALDTAGSRRAYIMLVDADFQLMVEDRQRFLSLLQSYEYDVISMVQKNDATQFSNVRIVKAQLNNTHWVGAVHEYLHTESSARMELSTEVRKGLSRRTCVCGEEGEQNLAEVPSCVVAASYICYRLPLPGLQDGTHARSILLSSPGPLLFPTPRTDSLVQVLR